MGSEMEKLKKSLHFKDWSFNTFTEMEDEAMKQEQIFIY